MAENQKPDSDDEFEFSEGEEEHDIFADEKHDFGERNVLEGAGRKSIFVAVGIIVAALALYKLFDIFISGKSITHKTTPVPTVAVTPTLIAPTPVPVVQPIQPTQPVQPVISSDLQEQINSLQSTSDDNKQKISNLNDSVVGLSTTLSTIQESMNAINQQLQTLTEQLETQQNDIAKLTPKPKPKKIVKYKPPVVIKPKLYVQALMPGRAWLVDASGFTVTVQIGDYLPGFGKITSISIVKGIVVTSSGAIIRYRDL